MFKFSIGSKVHSSLHNMDGIVKYRQAVETAEGDYNEYGIIFHLSNDTREIEVSEDWIQEGWDSK